MKLILLTNVFATLFMVGLIWFVQIVHYPLFANVGKQEFRIYEQLHQKLTTWVVGPAMLIELATAVALLRVMPTDTRWLVWSGIALVGIVWISTATLSVPAHNSLTLEYSDAAYRKLVNTNWIRTIGWSVRGVLMLYLVSRYLGTPPA